MARTAQLLDHRGNPVQRATLQREVATPTTMGLRRPISGYPGDGLNPIRLAEILRAADMGDPTRYLELAETIEERDLHYAGVLGTRRRSVNQLDITVEAASDSSEDVARADRVRAWLKRDELTEEMFDILDCIGKGVSFTEIIWDTSEGQWQPDRLEWRDPRWFGVDRLDLKTPLIKSDTGAEESLPAFKFIAASIKAKSGLPLRSGLSRIAMWAYMFKKFTERDWAVFTQTYGQPLRVGKWASGASEADKETLYRAVANIAGDCAAIIPEAMTIEFVETGSVSANGDLYETRADWLDRQISKCVLGQTSTTDAEVGGLGSGKEHREVQEDIERSDAKAAAAILNRDLIRPWMQLDYGPLKGYPRLVIARAEAIDMERLSKSVAPLIDRGLRVKQQELREKLGLSEPKDGDETLGPVVAPEPPQVPSDPAAEPPAGPLKGQRGVFEGGLARLRGGTALNAAGLPVARSDDHPVSAAVEALTDRLETESAAPIEGMIDQVEAMLSQAGSLEEFREMILSGFPVLDSGSLARVMAQAMIAAWGAGRVTVEEEALG